MGLRHRVAVGPLRDACCETAAVLVAWEDFSEAGKRLAKPRNAPKAIKRPQGEFIMVRVRSLFWLMLAPIGVALSCWLVMPVVL